MPRAVKKVGVGPEICDESGQVVVVVMDRWRVWTNALQLLWWWATHSLFGSFDGDGRDETLPT